MATQITLQNWQELNLSRGQEIIVKYDNVEFDIHREFKSTVSFVVKNSGSRAPIKLTSSYEYRGEEYNWVQFDLDGVRLFGVTYWVV